MGYSKPNYDDCARWLTNFCCEKIKHLDLSELFINDHGLDAILENDTFANLESLSIGEGYQQCHVTPDGVEPFLRNLRLPKLKYLALHNTRIGDRIALLCDPSILPTVQFATFRDTVASPESIRELGLTRPFAMVSR